MTPRGSAYIARQRQHKRKQRLLLLIILSFFMLIAASGGALFFLLRQDAKPNMEVISFHDYHALDPQQSYVILDGTLLENIQLPFIADELYLPVDFITFTNKHKCMILSQIMSVIINCMFNRPALRTTY